MDYTVHGILQARILEWVAGPFSRGSSQPRDQTQFSCIAGGFFTSWVTKEAPLQKSAHCKYTAFLNIVFINTHFEKQSPTFHQRAESSLPGNFKSCPRYYINISFKRLLSDSNLQPELTTTTSFPAREALRQLTIKRTSLMSMLTTVSSRFSQYSHVTEQITRNLAHE